MSTQKYSDGRGRRSGTRVAEPRSKSVSSLKSKYEQMSLPKLGMYYTRSISNQTKK